MFPVFLVTGLESGQSRYSVDRTVSATAAPPEMRIPAVQTLRPGMRSFTALAAQHRIKQESSQTDLRMPVLFKYVLQMDQCQS